MAPVIPRQGTAGIWLGGGNSGGSGIVRGFGPAKFTDKSVGGEDIKTGDIVWGRRRTYCRFAGGRRISERIERRGKAPIEHFRYSTALRTSSAGGTDEFW